MSWSVGTDAFRRLLEQMGESRWGWARGELPGVLERFGWTWVEDDELGVTVDLGPAFAEAERTTTRVAWKGGPVKRTMLVLATGDAADPADALRLGDEFERLLGIATQVLGAPSERRPGPTQVASWRRAEEQGTIQLVQHRRAVNLRWSSNAAQVRQDGWDAEKYREQAAEFARTVRPDPDAHVDALEAPELGGERLIEQVLTEDPSWERFAQVFARALLRLRDGSTLILTRPGHNYVQFQYDTGRDATDHFFSLEVSSNAVREEDAQLTEADQERLRGLGFTGPEPPFQDENWRIDQNRAIDTDLAEQYTGQALRALREVVRAQRPADLSVKAFNAFA